MRHRDDFLLPWIGIVALVIATFLPLIKRVLAAFPDVPPWILIPVTLVASLLLSVVVLIVVGGGLLGAITLGQRMRRR